METPREYGFNDISKEIFLKQINGSFLCVFVLIHSDPLFQQATSTVRQREEGHITSLQPVVCWGSDSSHIGPQLCSYLLGLMHHVWMKVGC